MRKKLMPHLPETNARNGEALLSPYVTCVPLAGALGANLNISYLPPINYCHTDLKGQRLGS